MLTKRATNTSSFYDFLFIAFNLQDFRKKSNEQFTCSQIINTLKDMNFFEITGESYILTYTRNNLTDSLHDVFGFRTDYEMVDFFKIFKKFKIFF